MNLEQIAEKYRFNHQVSLTVPDPFLAALTEAYNLGKQESTESAIKEGVREELEGLQTELSTVLEWCSRDEEMIVLHVKDIVNTRLSELSSTDLKK